MNEIDLIKKIKTDYTDLLRLNEAETRFKIIDEILEKYLKWPKSNTCVEFFVQVHIPVILTTQFQFKVTT